MSALAALVLACAPASQVAAPEAPPRQDGLVLHARRYAQDERDLERFFELRSSERRRERLAEFFRAERERLAGLDYAALGPGARVDWQLVARRVDEGQRELELARARAGEVAELVPFADELFRLEESRWGLEEFDAAEVAARLFELAEELGALQERVQARDEEGGDEPGDAGADESDALEVDRVRARRAAGVVGEARRALRTWYEHHAPYLPGFAWWLAEPREALDDALDAYAEHLRETIAEQRGEAEDPLVGEALGRSALEAAVRGERLAYGPEELLAIGERELAWCEAELLRAAAELGHGEDWRAALEAVKRLHVEPGAQDALVRDQARAAVRFLDERDLVTIDPLCRETWRVTMLSRRGQETLPFAAYGGQEMLVAFPTRDMPHDEKVMSLRGNNEHFTRIVTPHELIPGHHLQRFASDRFATWRRSFGTPFYVEGWALYWEMRLWELGWARGPEDRIGMLFWRMHRAARILVSLRFHLGEATPEEMIEFLVERVGHERANATAEVRRYVGDGYGPLYQCAYMIGGLQLRALHRELVERGGWSERGFHDAVLAAGAIPFELVRAELRGDLLPRDWTPSWRFAD